MDENNYILFQGATSCDYECDLFSALVIFQLQEDNTNSFRDVSLCL